MQQKIHVYYLFDNVPLELEFLNVFTKEYEKFTLRPTLLTPLSTKEMHKRIKQSCEFWEASFNHIIIAFWNTYRWNDHGFTTSNFRIVN